MSSFIPVLELAGLDESSERVYHFVITTGKVRIADVVDGFGLSEDAAGAALENLRGRGLVSRVVEGVYVPVDPRSALKSIADRLSEKVGLIHRSIPTLADQFDKGVSEDTETAETKVVSDRDAVGSWYVRLQHLAAHDFMIFDRPPYVSEQLEPLETVVLGRGVSWRGLYTADSFRREGAWAEAERLAAHGEQARITSELPVKLAIADRRIALVSLSVDADRSDAIITTSPPLVAALCDLFEFNWARALPLPATRSLVDDTRPDAGLRTPTREEQFILALIGSGLTDDAIASQLGMSTRSFRRRSHELMVELGASNRFKAGVEAARRGWI